MGNSFKIIIIEVQGLFLGYDEIFCKITNFFSIFSDSSIVKNVTVECISPKE